MDTLREKGHNVNRNSVECKWRYLVSCYNKVKQNKNTTGRQRKTFKYFNELDTILGKRHDVSPPVLSGSGTVAPLFTETSGKTKKPAQKQQLSDSDASTGDDVSEADTSLNLSNSKSAKRRRQHRRASMAKETGNAELLEFLRECEESRREESKKREENKERRAKERTELLRECLAELRKTNTH